MSDASAARAAPGGKSRGFLAAHLLTLPVSVSAGARTRPAIAPTLRINVGVGRVVRVALRAVGLLRSGVYGAIPGGVASWSDSLKVRRIAASTVRTVVPPRAFLRVVANMVDNHSLGDRAVGHLIGDGVRLMRPSADIEGPIPLGQSPIPQPTNIGSASVNKGCVAFHRIASNRASSAGKGRAMPTHPQVMGVAQTELLDVQRSTASVDGAYLLRHV